MVGIRAKGNGDPREGNRDPRGTRLRAGASPAPTRARPPPRGTSVLQCVVAGLARQRRTRSPKFSDMAARATRSR